jgi:hypothetical protein
MNMPITRLPPSEASTRAVVISQPSRLRVRSTVIGLSSGETNTNAVRVPTRAPASPLRPAASGIVVQEQPRRTAPAATAAGPARAAAERPLRPGAGHERLDESRRQGPDCEPRKHRQHQRAEFLGDREQRVHRLV